MFSYTTYRPVYNASMVGGLPWSWWDGSWIYNYVYNRCLSQLTLWVRIPLRRGVLDTVFCDKVCQWLAAGQWFSPGTSVSSTNKSDPHDITEILLTVVLTTITLTHNEPWPVMVVWYYCLFHNEDYIITFLPLLRRLLPLTQWWKNL